MPEDPNCQSWCATKDRPWSTLCKWESCKTCPQCAVRTPDFGPFNKVALQRRMPAADAKPAAIAPTDCPVIEGAEQLTPLAGANTLLQAKKYVLSGAADLRGYSLGIPAGGELILSDGASLQAREIVVNGTLTAGSAACPITGKVTVTLTGGKSGIGSAELLDSKAGMKGILVHGAVSLFGRRPYPTWTRLGASAWPGNSSIELAETVDWRAGDRVVVVTTAWQDDPDSHQNEVREIAAVSGKRITLTEPLSHPHYGGAEYQAEVALLDRSITVQGDEGSEAESFGAHIMCRPGSRCRIAGVRAYRAGQLNVMGRYPFHLHMMGDVAGGSFFHDNTVERSYFRGYTVHGTHNTTLHRNVAFDVQGSVYYMEDGVEEDNDLFYNLAAFVHVIGRLPDYSCGKPAQVGCTGIRSSADRIVSSDVSAVGFYCTNAHNRWVGNAASGGFSGFAFPALPKVLGLSYAKNTAMEPYARPLLQFDSNSAHSSGRLWEANGACIYIGGELTEDPPGSGVYVYTYGRVQPNRPVGGYNFSNTNVAVCNKGVVFWGSGYGAAEPHLNLYNFEAHDIFKAAHLMGDCAVENAVWTGHSRNYYEGSWGEAPLIKESNLFEQYDLAMQTILANVHMRGLDQEKDCGVKDVTRSSTVNSALTIAGVSFDSHVPTERYFRHVPEQHCNIRQNYALHENSPCKLDCETTCAGTSWSSQVTSLVVEGPGLPGFPEGAILGPKDQWNETGEAQDKGTNDWWLAEDGCRTMFETAYSGGFWVCPRKQREVATVVLNRGALPFVDGESGEEVKGWPERWRSDYAGPYPPSEFVESTWFHFGHRDRRAHMRYGLLNINGICCDVGWYVALANGAEKAISFFLGRMPVNDGLILATSYPLGASVTVEMCNRPLERLGQRTFDPICETLTCAASLQEMRQATGPGCFLQSTGLSETAYVRMPAPDFGEASYFSVAGHRQLRQGMENSRWFTLRSDKVGHVPIDLPPALP